MATEWAARVISAADLAKLDDLIATMEAAQAAGDGKRYVPANRDFHFTVYRAAGSETLLSIIESLCTRTPPYFDLLNAAGVCAPPTPNTAGFDALGAGDGAEARAALKADIEGAARIPNLTALNRNFRNFVGRLGPKRRHHTGSQQRNASPNRPAIDAIGTSTARPNIEPPQLSSFRQSIDPLRPASPARYSAEAARSARRNRPGQAPDPGWSRRTPPTFSPSPDRGASEGTARRFPSSCIASGC